MRAVTSTILAAIFIASFFLIGCGPEEAPRKIISETEAETEPVKQPAKTTTTARTGSSADTFGNAIAACEYYPDKNMCYMEVIGRFKHLMTEQNTYSFSNVCKQIPEDIENPSFDADSFDWETFPTLRMQCFRRIGDTYKTFGKAETAAKEWCDGLDGNGIDSGDSYRDYCYVEIAEARKYDDTRGAEELCYKMPDSLMRRHCCQTVYGKHNTEADRCTKVLV